MSDWKPRDKYEVAPGLWIGSEIGDIDREVKQLMPKWAFEGDKEAFDRIRKLQERRTEILFPRFKDRNG